MSRSGKPNQTKADLRGGSRKGCFCEFGVSSLKKNSGREKVPKRTCATKTLPNFRVNFLVRFASKPCFIGYCPRIVQTILWCCSCDFWLWGSFLALEKQGNSQDRRNLRIWDVFVNSPCSCKEKLCEFRKNKTPLFRELPRQSAFLWFGLPVFS